MKFIIYLIAVFGVLAASAQAAVYDKPYIGEMDEIHTKYEDTFVHLALEHDLGYVEMRSANPLVDPWVPGAGTRVILPKRHLLPDANYEGIVINLPEMRLYYFPKDGSEPQAFPIGVGREGLATPMGSTTIVRKMEGPTWRPTARMRKEHPELPEAVGPGPENPLGTHALYLGWPEYAIHGTNKPFGIGRRVSSGCIRMYPVNIIKLFNMAPVGTKVTVVDQPIKLAWIDDRLYIEAHTNLEQSILMEENGEVKSKLMKSDMERIKKFAGEYKDRIRWAAVRTAIRERKGYPIEIGRRSGLGERTTDDKSVAADMKEIEKELELEPQAGEDAKAQPHPETQPKAQAAKAKRKENIAEGDAPVTFEKKTDPRVMHINN